MTPHLPRLLVVAAVCGSLSSLAADAGSAPSPAPSGAPAEFLEDAKLVYDVVGCSPERPLPANLDAKVIEAYCKELRPRIEKYRKKWVGEAEPFIAALKPKGLPDKVVYPFGGGDLLSALTTYPEASEFTTLSLELAGDPRRLRTLASKDKLKTSLETLRTTVAGLLTANDSKSENLSKAQQGEIPGQLGFFLIALAIHGYEPVGLRYFKLDPGGAIHYLTEPEIAALEPKKAGHLKSSWVSPDFSEAFANAELQFVKKGSPAGTAPKVHRHLGANLSDDNLNKDPSLIKHLELKGKVSAMTKAATYLLWRDNFSVIRGYLLKNMVFMISDSTGIPPRFTKKAGFVQETYGTFEGSFLPASEELNDEFRDLWSDQPERKLPFRYGYIDSSRHDHMLVTKRAPEKP